MKIKVDSFNIGSDGARISPDCKITFSDWIYLTLDFSANKSPENIIGTCNNVWKGKDGIYADIEKFEHLDYLNTDELYPTIGGIIQKSNQKENYREITKFKLNEVSLCSSKNVDPAIKSIKDQLKS